MLSVDYLSIDVAMYVVTASLFFLIIFWLASDLLPEIAIV